MSNKTKTLKGKTPSRRKFIKAAAATGVAAVATPGVVVVVATQLQVVQLALFKDCNAWSMLLGYRHTVWCMLGTCLGSAIEWCHLHQQIADGGGLKPT